MSRFPTGRWGRRKLVFHPAPARAPFRPFAALAFIWHQGKVLICDIPGRGWCIPSGRVEALETSAEAARREAFEEGGAHIDNVRYIGCYQIFSNNSEVWAEAYTASLASLVEIPEGSESKGRKFENVENLPASYHIWDELTEAIFGYARSVFER